MVDVVQRYVTRIRLAVMSVVHVPKERYYLTVVINVLNRVMSAMTSTWRQEIVMVGSVIQL